MGLAPKEESSAGQEKKIRAEPAALRQVSLLRLGGCRCSGMTGLRDLNAD